MWSKKVLEVKIKVVVEKIIYKGADHFVVLRGLNLADNNSCVVTGQIPGVFVAMRLELEGCWITNPKFGLQFKVKYADIGMPTDVVAIEKFLGDGFVKGVGKATAAALIKAFGQDTLIVLDQSPEKLESLPKFGKAKVSAIIKAWQEIKETSHTFVFLAKLGISKFFANKLFSLYGQSTVSKVKENPYLLSREVYGVGFLKADAIALRLNIPKDSAYRIEAAINYVIRSFLENGSLFVEESNLTNEVLALLKLPDAAEAVKQVLLSLLNTQELGKKLKNGLIFYAFKKVIAAEEELVSMLLILKRNTNAVDLDSISASVRLLDLASTTNISLSDEQIDAICNAFIHPVTIITGGPGTGKTTLLKSLIQLLQEKKCTFALAAPTGRAAKRIQQATGSFAQTLHRLLEFDPVSKRFNKNTENCLAVDYVIVDEFSMVDLFLFNGLLRSINPRTTKIVLIGDVDQLPSVGPGKLLQDMLESRSFKTIFLSTVFRQAKESLIIQNAHNVNNGIFPAIKNDLAIRDFMFVRMDDPADFQGFLKTRYLKLLQSKDLAASQGVILTPMHKGLVGSIQINSDLQALLNPISANEIVVFNNVYRVGDPVMQLKNNYDKGVFNGDTGKIIAIKNQAELSEITVDFFGRQFIYKYHEFIELSLAYAMSIHKSQGSEFCAVMIPVFTQHFMMLNKNILYTAITRAKKLCILVGQIKAIAIAVKKSQPVSRVTFLQELLQSQDV